MFLTSSFCFTCRSQDPPSSKMQDGSSQPGSPHAARTQPSVLRGLHGARPPSDPRSPCPASARHTGLPIHPGTPVPLQGRSFPNRCRAGSRTLAHPWAVQNGSCWSPEGCTNRPPNTVGVGGHYGTGAVMRADRGVWGYRLFFGRTCAQGSRVATAVVSGAGARASLKCT